MKGILSFCWFIDVLAAGAPDHGTGQSWRTSWSIQHKCQYAALPDSDPAQLRP